MKKKRQFKRHVLAAVEAIKEQIDNNQAIDDTTADMAKQFGVSRNVLQAAFKQKYGITIRAYKLQTRMAAARLLLEGGKDAKEVSLILNYASQSGFTAAFKIFYGITPAKLVNGHGYAILAFKK